MRISNNTEAKGVVIVKQKNINDKEGKLIPKFFHQ